MRWFARFALTYFTIFNAISMAQAPAVPEVVDWSARGLNAKQKAVVSAAQSILEEAQVSYVYGGYQLGDPGECLTCNECLETQRPTPNQRLKICPICAKCSIDCSHFTALVFERAGIAIPYIDTKTMLQLSPDALKKRYLLQTINFPEATLAVGDLLVYSGHVVMVERLQPLAPHEDALQTRADIVHATGGRDIKGAGQGVQRERLAAVANFRGPLLKVLRRVAILSSENSEAIGSRKAAVALPKQVAPDAYPKIEKSPSALPTRPIKKFKLRPIEKRQAP